MIHRVREYLDTVKYTFDEEGIQATVHKSAATLRSYARDIKAHAGKLSNSFYDVVFVNGCDFSVPHPIRYRVEHQMEQLQAAGVACEKVNAWDISEDWLRQGRVFVIFRCPITPEMESFITEAKKLNKTVLYDIDDLVFDTAYTDLIPYVQNLAPQDKAVYDDGVVRMGETLRLCDGAITTTEELARELERFVSPVFVNRNTASMHMVKLSQEAVYRRDVLPSLDPDSLPGGTVKKHINALARAKEREGVVRIGYFSGSITHNDDFDLVLPALVRILEEHPQTRLVVVGELDVPEQLSDYVDRIDVLPFCSWKRLPFYIASVDINIAPLRDTLFNRAKSENKWVEASLVKVPTVASAVGAFENRIEDDVTGLLCGSEDEWFAALSTLVRSEGERSRLGEAAYDHCMRHCTTIPTCQGIAKFIDSRKTPNIAMTMPSMNTSGGVLVALKHGQILQKNGYDVTFISTDDKHVFFDYESTRFPVLNRNVFAGDLDKCDFEGGFDIAVATLWDTLDFLKRYPRIEKMLYNVQNFETGFYPPGNPLRVKANATYAAPNEDVNYITISKWCQQWLLDDFGKSSKYAPNGIDTAKFYPVERDFSNRRVRILVEGDCRSEYKNVDESFAITNQLDPARFEIWYMNYTGAKKPHYRIDRELGSVDPAMVPDVYRQCDILLKTSVLESFSYPPLEMMATGGYVVAIPNEGNREYLVDGENCLLFEHGDAHGAIERIERICSDEALRAHLRENGLATARARDWEHLEGQILSLYV